jgi:hypothetical protein
MDPEPFGRLRVFVVTPLLSPPVGNAAGAMASLSLEELEGFDEVDEVDDFGRGVASSLVGRLSAMTGVGSDGVVRRVEERVEADEATELAPALPTVPSVELSITASVEG